MDVHFQLESEKLSNEYLVKTEYYSLKHKNSQISDFFNNVKFLCEHITNMQQVLSLSTIAHIEYTIAYANILNRNYVAEVWAYGDELYLDKKQQMIGTLDITPLFTSFNELWDELLANRKRYGGTVRAMEVNDFMRQSLPSFSLYLVAVARSAIAQCLDSNIFNNIAKHNTFRVCVGGYMNTIPTNCIYIERKNKDNEQILFKFKARPSEDYIFEDYSELDFCSQELPKMNFSYSYFRNSQLNDVSFDNSLLMSTNFSYAKMQNCKLKNTTIYGADFSHAYLVNASFENAMGRAGLPKKDKWQHVGFLPVSFRFADLTNVSFKNADLTGADFSSAILTDTDFSGAILDGAIFDKS